MNEQATNGVVDCKSIDQVRENIDQIDRYRAADTGKLAPHCAGSRLA